VKLASRLFAEPLHRGRALWELHQIDGYRGDRSALLAKVHHAMIDGVSGVELLGVMFDVTPRPAPVTPPPDDARPARRLPTPAIQLARAIRESVETAVARARTAAEIVRRPADAVSAVGDVAATLGEAIRLVVTPTPSTPFNGHVSVLRQVVWWTTSLNEVKAIKNRLGGTVNDVVLTTISAALRGYLEGRGFTTDRLELRAMVPVNVRKPAEKGNLGNRVSMMVAPLPVGIFDPLERLRQVRTAMAKLKESGQVGRITKMLDLMELLPPAVQKPLGWLQVQAAPVNTVCTNVPGPPVSLYFQGHRLETLVPLVPLAQGVGLAFAILTYADAMTIGITADPALVPDVDRFPELLQAGHEELRVLAAVDPDTRGHVPPRPERQRRAERAPSRVA
jgi:WS/DGAT/MGAT family acyltransferase